MKHRDLYVFKRGLDKSSFLHPRITYAVTKNKRLVSEAIKDLDKVREPDTEYKKFEEEKSILANNYAVSNANGSKINHVPDILTGEMRGYYNIPDADDTKSPYRKELFKLEKKYKSAIDKHKEKEKKFEEFINEESDIKPYMIDFELLEQNEKCPQEIMDKIYWMINEPKS